MRLIWAKRISYMRAVFFIESAELSTYHFLRDSQLAGMILGTHLGLEGVPEIMAFGIEKKRWDSDRFEKASVIAFGYPRQGCMECARRPGSKISA